MLEKIFLFVKRLKQQVDQMRFIHHRASKDAVIFSRF